MAKTSKTELIRELKPSFRIPSPFSRFWKLFSSQKKLTKTSLSSPPFTSFPNSTSDCHKNVKKEGGVGIQFKSSTKSSYHFPAVSQHFIILLNKFISSRIFSSPHIIKSNKFFWIGGFPNRKTNLCMSFNNDRKRLFPIILHTFHITTTAYQSINVTLQLVPFLEEV